MKRLIALATCVVFAIPAAAECNWSTLQPGQWCEVADSMLAHAVRCQDPEFTCTNPDKPRNVCPNGGTNSKGVGNVMEAWSGGTYDSLRHRLVIFGGGHADYCGNELYGFDVDSLSWSQLTPASANVGGSDSSNQYPDGRPRSYHTYDRVIYVPSIDRYCAINGAAQYPGTSDTDTFWCNDPSQHDVNNNTGTQGWAEVFDPPVDLQGNKASYSDGWVYVDDASGHMFRWDGQSTWQQISSSSDQSPFDVHSMSGIDHANGAMASIGDGKFWGRDLATGVKMDNLASPPSACGKKAPGWQYDSSIGKFVAWCGGNKTYTYELGGTWSTCDATGGVTPTSPQTQGTYGRFAYVPHHNGYVLVNRTIDKVYLYRLPAECGGSDPDGPGGPGSGTDCDDGLDNDGDGFCDAGQGSCADGSVPGDQGCDGSSDDSEQATNECDDGADNDGDGKVDLDDAGCSGPAGGDESDCGDFVCEGSESESSCAPDCTAASGSVLNPGPVDFDLPTQTSIGYRIPVVYSLGSPTDNDYDATVAVRYRSSAGPSTWKVGPNASRIRDTPEIVGGADPAITDHFGGAIWGLTAETSYDIEFQINDPDGYNETRVVTTSTAIAPIATGPTTHTASTLAALRELLDGDSSGDASAGDVIEITASLTNDSSLNMVEIKVSGESITNPIIIKCTSRDIVLDANAQRRVFWFPENQGNNVYIENCTLTGTGASGYIIRGASGGGHNTIVIRRNIIRQSFWENDSSFGGVRFDGTESAPNSAIYVEDNFLEGPNSHPIRRTGRAEGIRITGVGGTISHNLLRGFGDAIGFRSSGGQFAIRNVVIYGNDIQFTKDDAIEADGTDMVIIHHNRAQNYNACVSAQPTFGGPTYFARNVCWSGGKSRHLKIDSGPTTRVNQLKLWNNLLQIQWANYSNKAFSFEMLNNLWIGEGPPDEEFAIDSSMRYLGFNNGNDGESPPAQPDALWDYNMYSYDASFRVANGQGGSLATWQDHTGFDLNSAIIPEPIFSTPQTPYPDGTDYFAFHEIADPRLHAESAAIDSGTTIAGITEGFAGAEPDIGPIEYGDPVYEYGLLTWSYPYVHCNDGIDNDRDGLTDLADSGCASGTDPSEKGTVYVCDNGVDEDEDKLFDYPDDPGCSGPTDGTEDVVDEPTDPPAPPTNLQVD